MTQKELIDINERLKSIWYLKWYEQKYKHSDEVPSDVETDTYNSILARLKHSACIEESDEA